MGNWQKSWDLEIILSYVRFFFDEHFQYNLNLEYCQAIEFTLGSDKNERDRKYKSGHKRRHQCFQDIVKPK